MDDEQFADLNYKNTIAEQVISLAKLAKEAGMDGVVASPKEAAAIREACGPEFLIVTRAYVLQAALWMTRSA
mgnify:CR=1 FL=1